MKKIYRLLFFAIAASSLLVVSCETLELEKVDNPNVLSPDQADPALLFNRIQMEYMTTVRSFSRNGAALGRINYLGNDDYFNAVDGGTLDFAWNNFYADMLPDIAALKTINDGNPDLDLSVTIGIAQVMQAHVMSLLVDYLGDIIYTEANNPAEFPNPQLDEDTAVYAAAAALLDEAIANLGSGANLVGTDLFGGPDWTKVANTIKMRMNLNQGNFSAVYNATNVIDVTADDLEFPYGDNQLNPDNRHPWYAAGYRDDGANNYLSNWMFQNMVGTYGDFFEDDDPRRRYYFYRQSAVTPGSFTLLRRDSDGAFFIYDGGENVEVLECSGNTVFSHLEFTPEEDYWCGVKMGYWGRDHLNNEGTPPDGSLRTTYGVYPASGMFDDHNDFVTYDGTNVTGYTQASVFLGAGGGGNGIEPIYLSSYVHFMKAIAYMGDNDPANAAIEMRTALEQSIAKVQTFGSKDPGADLSIAPDAARVTAFIDDTVQAFNDADMTTALDGNGWPVAKDKMDILSEQYFITMWGAGSDAYTFIKKFGYPRTLGRGWEPNRGNFPRTFLYPNSEASTNPSVIQRENTEDRVFWDAGVLNPSN